MNVRAGSNCATSNILPGRRLKPNRCLKTNAACSRGQLFHRMVQQHLVGLPVEKLSRLANTPDLTRWWENYLGYNFNIIDYTHIP